MKEGSKEPGYPRFKGRDHYDSITYPSYGDGIRLKNNRLRIQHVGMVRAKITALSMARSRQRPLNVRLTSGTSFCPASWQHSWCQ